MAIDKLKQISDSVCKEYLGFLPTSNSTKPPHIANGLFRLCTGETCNTRDVHEWIFGDSHKDSTTSEEIIAKYEAVFQDGRNEKPLNVKAFRLLLEDIFNQDNVGYAGENNYGYSVLPIASHWMIRGKVNSEGQIGDFLFKLLSKEIDGERSPMIDKIQKALENDNDDITSIIKPIIAFPSDKEKRNKTSISFDNDSDIAWDKCKQTIREGFDRLSHNLEVTGECRSTLLVLRRVVNYSVFATYYYLTHCNYALYNGENVPIVIDAGDNLESIQQASEQSYTQAKKAVEEFFSNSINAFISQEIRTDTVEECKKWISDIAYSSTEREDNIKPALNSYFDSFCDEEGSPIYALARALQIILYTFEYKNNSPSDFCRVLGIRSGLVGPKGNRAKLKRYLLNSFMLETVTLSILEKNELTEGIELKDLSEKFLKIYNIIIGANTELEYSVLEECNIAQSTPGDLRGDLSINAQRLANTYISLGLGKKYADGVTLIGWRL